MHCGWCTIEFFINNLYRLSISDVTKKKEIHTVAFFSCKKKELFTVVFSKLN